MFPIVSRTGLLVVVTAALAGSIGIAQTPPPAIVVQAPDVPLQPATRGAADRADLGDFYYYDGAPVPLHRSLTDTVVRFRAGRDVGALVNEISPQATIGPAISAAGREYRVVSIPAGQLAAPAQAWAEQLRAQADVEFAAPALIYPATGRSLLPTEEIVVKLGPGTAYDALVELATAQDLKVARGQPYTTDEFVLVLNTPKSSDPVAISRALHESGILAWAEPNFIQFMQRMATPNDPRFGQQWHLNNTGALGGTPGADVKAPAAWDIETGKASTVIAIIDDSVDRAHEDLAPNMFVNPLEIAGNGVDDDGNTFIDDVSGWDFASNDNNPNPFFTDDNHGTAVAGVAAGRGNNGLGITGSCPSCRILPVRIAFVSGTQNSVYGNAIRYAATLADVLNNSWGGGSPSSVIQSAIAFAITSGRAGKGSVVLFASGNSASAFGSITATGLPAGTHRFRWTYSKDDTVNSGDDTVWLSWVLFPGQPLQTFQGGALPTGWVTGGNANWAVVTDPIHTDEGMCLTRAVKAGTIGPNQATALEVVRTVQAGNFRSYQWVSSESGFDGLKLEIDLNNNGTVDLATSLISGVPFVNPGVSYPAAYPESIAVGATSDRDCRARYSQVGPQLAFVAPSNSSPLNAAIETTDRMGSVGYDAGNYTQALGTSGFGGTSSATPLAAGIAGLIISRNPALTRLQVLQIMQNTADKVGTAAYTGGRNDRYGSGRLNAHQALLATPGGTPALPTAVNDSYGTPFNTPLVVAPPGVLANDNTNNGGLMTATALSAAANGTVSPNGNGGFTYTPNSGFSGADSFTYRATNQVGPSNNIATVVITVAGPVVGPQPPTNLRITSMVGNTVTFAWNLPTAGSTPTGILFEGGLVPGQVVGSLPLGLVPSFTVALPTGSFFLRVRTLSGGTTSAPSNEVQAHVNVPVAPSAPANLLGVVVGDTLSLAWTNTFAGGAPSNVILEVSGALSGAAPLGLTDTFSVAGVPPGTYTLTVRATNVGGSSAASNPVTLTFPTGCSGAPLPVANFVAYNVGSTLFLSWDTAASGPAPTGYALNVTGSFVGSIPTPVKALSGAVPPGTYNFSVTASNACGASAPTAVQTVTIP